VTKPRGPTTEMPTTRRIHGGYEASIRFRGRRLWRRGKTKTEARTRLLEALAQPTEEPPPSSGPTCGQLVEHAIEERRTSVHTTADRLSAWRKWGAPIASKRPDPELVRRWALGLPNGERGACAARVAFDCAAWALPLDRKWRPRPKRDDDKRRVYSADELARLTEAAEADRFGDLLLVALATGLRAGELLGLQADDVGDGVLAVRRQVDKSGSVSPLKTRSSRRDIAIGPKTTALLRARGGPLIWRTSTGRPLQRTFVHRVWTRIHDRAGVERRSPHSARHHHISSLIQSGAPVGEVSKRAGHRSVSVTLSLYTHHVPGTESEAMRAAIDAW